MAGSTTDGRSFQPLFLLFLVFCSFLFSFWKPYYVYSINLFLLSIFSPISNWLISIVLSFVWQHWAENGILALQPGVKLLLSAVEVQHLNHFSTREVPHCSVFKFSDPSFCLTFSGVNPSTEFVSV